jgi:hypothetical protein
VFVLSEPVIQGQIPNQTRSSSTAVLPQRSISIYGRRYRDHHFDDNLTCPLGSKGSLLVRRFSLSLSSPLPLLVGKNTPKADEGFQGRIPLRSSGLLQNTLEALSSSPELASVWMLYPSVGIAYRCGCSLVAGNEDRSRWSPMWNMGRFLAQTSNSGGELRLRVDR